MTVACLFVSCGGADDRIAGLFRQGNAFYEKGQYAEAAKAYESIEASGVRNGYMYYNLGNARFKQQQVGRAILAYERARRLMPRDADIKANLAIAGLRTIDQIRTPEPWLGRSILLSVTVNEAMAATSVIFGMATALCLGFILSPAPDVRRLMVRIGMGVGPLLLIGALLTSIKIYDEASRTEAVLLTAVSEARSGPGETYEPLFVLHEGAKVNVVETRGAWLRVQLPDGKSGWIEQKALEII